jgi:prepilin-type N-terminal cleavage/methylation domain-containing protein
MKNQLPAYNIQLSGKSGRFSHSRNAQRATLKAGFTLIELLVVVGIIIALSALMLANINKFGGQSLLQNLAYDIALSIREAQVYGIAVQGASGNFNAGYGMHFDMSHASTYNLFADTAQIGVYKAGEDVSPSPYTIGQGFYIFKICATPSAGSEICTGSAPTSVNQLDILFIRPEPDAYISINDTPLAFNGAGQVVGGSPYTQARIVVTSPRGDYMSIVVSSNGQISVEADSNGT